MKIREYGDYVFEISLPDVWKTKESGIPLIQWNIRHELDIFNGGCVAEMSALYQNGDYLTNFGIQKDDPFGMKFEYLKRNGTKLEKSENYSVLWIDSNYYELKDCFTKEQLKDIRSAADNYLNEVGKIIGYYENNSFVVVGITFYSVDSENGDIENETEILNDELIKKAPEKTEIIYDKDYLELCDKSDVEEGASQAELYISGEMSDGDRTYDEAVFKTAEKYCQEKATKLEVEDGKNSKFEYIYEDDNLIGLCGVIDYSKTYPDALYVPGARFSFCIDINKYLKAELFSQEMIVKTVITFAIAQLLALLGMLIIFISKREIKNSKKTKDTMINALAHEMTIPAEVIATSLEKINEGDESAVEHNENIICEEAEHISNLVNLMLSHTRKSGVKYNFNIRKTDINAIVENACRRFEQVAAKKDAGLEVDNNEICIIKADTKLMEIVVDNYISTALALCNPGTVVRIKITSSGMDVLYNGKVFSPEERAEIWRPGKKTGRRKNNENGYEAGKLYFSGEILKMHGFGHGVLWTDDGMNLFFSK